MKLTMVDGKVCQAFSGTLSSMTCYIFQATPKDMNGLDRVKGKVIDIKSYYYELSTLYTRIHFIENLLYVAYRLDLKKWQEPQESFLQTLN